MREEELALEQPTRDYYRSQGQDVNSLRYRLSGEEAIKKVEETLRGGWKRDKKGRVTPNERYRLMNEEGIARVNLMLRSAVTSVNHLSNYKNEQRILTQLKSLSKAFLQELVLNMKSWGAIIHIKIKEDNFKTYDLTSDFGHGFLYIHDKKIIDGVVHVWVKLKVRNKHIVLQVVENALLQSFLRALGGREQELTAPNVLYNETEMQQQNPSRGLSGFFRRNPPDNAGYM